MNVRKGVPTAGVVCALLALGLPGMATAGDTPTALPGAAARTAGAAPKTDAVSAQDPVPAFPGAEGFGAYASGGRGGEVYTVTNLRDSGPGSFRDAVSEPNRTVVFAVGGIIELESRVAVAANLTIAGQTAPGGGITLYGDGLSYQDADNTITRYLRIRQGIGGEPESDAVSVPRGNWMMFDHLSISWGKDETFSASVGDLNKPIDQHPGEITIQNSIIAQGLDPHSAGSLIETEGGVSLIRNLYIDQDIRTPKVKGVNQYVNNVVYNWRREAYILGDSQWTSRANVIGNYFVAGPDTESPPFVRGNLNFRLYAEDNQHDENRDGALNGYLIPRDEYTTVTWMDQPFDYPDVRTTDPETAYREVLQGVGATAPQDRVDRLLLDEVRSLGELGQIVTDENDPPMNGPGPVPGGPAPADADGDGMPDDWEREHDLDPATPDHNGDPDGDGYTNLEDYLNSLVD